MDPLRFRQLLEKYLPQPCVDYCFQLWESRPFDFRLRKKRVSKVGDFTHHHGRTPRITINQDSHPYLFLLTYIHEVAHLEVHLRCGRNIDPHGREWKDSFQNLMSPLLDEKFIPSKLLPTLRRHMADPMASSFSDPDLSHALRQLDERSKSATLLSDLPEGSVFGLHGRWFRKGLAKRTRVQCRELSTRKNYLVPSDAEIDGAQLSFGY